MADAGISAFWCPWEWNGATVCRAQKRLLKPRLCIQSSHASCGDRSAAARGRSKRFQSCGGEDGQGWQHRTAYADLATSTEKEDSNGKPCCVARTNGVKSCTRGYAKGKVSSMLTGLTF